MKYLDEERELRDRYRQTQESSASGDWLRASGIVIDILQVTLLVVVGTAFIYRGASSVQFWGGVALVIFGVLSVPIVITKIMSRQHGKL
jgi:hypothetical protein